MNRTLKMRVAEPSLGDRPNQVSLVDEAYDALKEAIRTNVFPPSYRATEAEIAQQLGMSRTPVHGAIIRLREEGLLDVLPRRGVFIRPISAEDIREIYDVLIAVEGMAAALLAALPPNVSEAAANSLDDETAIMKQALEQGELTKWAEADERFHDGLTELCGNRRLARIAATVRDQSHRARLSTLHLRPMPTDSAAEHALITDSIRRNVPGEAETAARSHRAGARDQLVPLLIHYGIRNM